MDNILRITLQVSCYPDRGLYLTNSINDSEFCLYSSLCSAGTGATMHWNDQKYVREPADQHSVCSMSKSTQRSQQSLYPSSGYRNRNVHQFQNGKMTL